MRESFLAQRVLRIATGEDRGVTMASLLEMAVTVKSGKIGSFTHVSKIVDVHVNHPFEGEQDAKKALEQEGVILTLANGGRLEIKHTGVRYYPNKNSSEPYTAPVYLGHSMKVLCGNDGELWRTLED